jgi:hypothetical protein
MDEETIDSKLKQALDAKDWQKASNILTKQWLAWQIQFTQHTNPNLKELSYLQMPIHTDDGTYLLLFTHVTGKKLQLQTGEKDGEQVVKGT